jgi:hypothetical protein
MPYKHFMNEAKGLVATVVTLAGGAMQLANVESIVRIAAGAAACGASVVMGRYFYYKTKQVISDIKLKVKPKDDEDQL